MNNSSSASGIANCFSSFEGSYCYRKTIEFTLSSILLLLSIMLLGSSLYKGGCRQKWAISINVSLCLSLLCNILFCFFNFVFWLYSLETFFYNIYYLCIVGYIVEAYILKTRKPSFVNADTNIYLLSHSKERHSCQKIFFYAIFIIFFLTYLAIFITSVYNEKPADNHEDSTYQFYEGSCQEIWYLCVNAVCTVLSIIVVIFLCLNHKQQMQKGFNLSNSSSNEENLQKNQPEKISEQDSGYQTIYKTNENQGKIINNPLNRLWIWVILNISCQLFNVIESGLYLGTSPEESCRIIKGNAVANDWLLLLFVILTMQMGYMGSLWYLNEWRLARNKQAVDRSNKYSDEFKATCNIQLFVPSKEETVFNL